LLYVGISVSPFGMMLKLMHSMQSGRGAAEGGEGGGRGGEESAQLVAVHV
jgi:hypothetical protein